MTAVAIAPVVPPCGGADRRGTGHGAAAARRPAPPVARFAPTRARSTVYGIATIDRGGRIADRSLLRQLGWTPGTRLTLRERDCLVRVTADSAGVVRVSAQGFLRLPAPVRYWCRLVAGDRVLLEADPAEGLLVVYSPAALDAMTGEFHMATRAGAP